MKTILSAKEARQIVYENKHDEEKIGVMISVVEKEITHAAENGYNDTIVTSHDFMATNRFEEDFPVMNYFKKHILQRLKDKNYQVVIEDKSEIKIKW